ncbi:carbon-nitrogen hydrolase family protein [Candidatus Omnitrophota bacterium]
MKRNLLMLLPVFLMALAIIPQQADCGRLSSGQLPPRKVVIGTAIHGYYGVKYPGLDQRLTEVEGLIDEVARECGRKYPDDGLDLVVLPEEIITIGKGRTAKTRSVRLEGPVLDRMGGKARQYNTYIIVPLDLAEADGTSANAAVLLDRKGEVAGIYRKVHLVASPGLKDLEGGHTPGKTFPVFECDFGRIAIQICFDLSFPDGWKALAEKGAEIVAVPTMSPQTSRPSAYALQGRYYVVTSNHRNNATVFNPAGRIDAQIVDGDNDVSVGGLKLTQNSVLVHRIDLSYAIVPWSGTLGDGQKFTKKYGDRVGYTYYRDEDFGIFWSNDPDIPISRMVKELELWEFEEYLESVRLFQDKARGGAAR